MYGGLSLTMDIIYEYFRCKHCALYEKSVLVVPEMNELGGKRKAAGGSKSYFTWLLHLKRSRPQDPLGLIIISRRIIVGANIEWMSIRSYKEILIR